MGTLVTSRATVRIERPARYGKQLVSHLSRKSGGEWNAETASGWINLLDNQATVDATEEHLELHVTAPADQVERLEGVVGGHLVGFARNLTIEVQWHRDDQTQGSVQVTES